MPVPYPYPQEPYWQQAGQTDMPWEFYKRKKGFISGRVQEMMGEAFYPKRGDVMGKHEFIGGHPGEEGNWRLLDEGPSIKELEEDPDKLNKLSPKELRARGFK